MQVSIVIGKVLAAAAAHQYSGSGFSYYVREHLASPYTLHGLHGMILNSNEQGRFVLIIELTLN